MDDWITGPCPPTPYFSLASDKAPDKYQSTSAGISYFFLLLRSFPVRWQHNLHPPPLSRHQTDSTALHISRRFIIKSELRVSLTCLCLYVWVSNEEWLERPWKFARMREREHAINLSEPEQTRKKWAVPTLQSPFLIHWLQDQRNKTCTERYKTPWEPLWRHWRH